MAQPLLRNAAATGNRLQMLVYVAWRNIWRNRVRSLLTVGGMVVGLTMMIVFGALMEGMYGQMVRYATAITLGKLQLQRQGYIDDHEFYALVPDELLARLRAETPYAYAPRMYAAALASAGAYAEGVLLKGIDPAAEARVTTLHQHVRRGRFALDEVRRMPPAIAGGRPLTVYPVVIGYQLARNLHVDVGGELVLITQAADGSIGNGLFRVVGVLKPVELGFDRSGVLLSLDAWQSLMNLPGGVHEVAVGLPEGVTLEQAQADMQAIVQAGARAAPPGPPAAAAGGRVVVRRWTEINPSLADMIELSQTTLLIIGVIILSIVALGILNTMLMAVFERGREFGILLAMGMGRGALLTMVMLESLFLAIVAGAVGSGTGALWAWDLQVRGWDLSRYAPDGIDWAGVIMEPVYRAKLLPEHISNGLAMMFVITLVAAFIPAWRTVRINLSTALHD